MNAHASRRPTAQAPRSRSGMTSCASPPEGPEAVASALAFSPCKHHHRQRRDRVLILQLGAPAQGGGRSEFTGDETSRFRDAAACQLYGSDGCVHRTVSIHLRCKRDRQLFMRERQLFMRGRQLFIGDRQLFIRDPELFMRGRQLFMRDRQLLMRERHA